MGQRIFIGHQSALEYLCRKRFFDGSPIGGIDYYGECEAPDPTHRTSAVSALPKHAPSGNDVVALYDGILRGMTRPLHVLVRERNAYKKTRSQIAHIWSGGLPKGSFEQIGRNVYVSSPEFCLLQMASTLDQIELLRLVFEFCGTYALAPCKDDPYRNCPPLVSLQHIRSFAQRAKRRGLRGANRLERTIRFARDKAASPTESIVTMLLTLPYRMGGYGLPLPALNHQPARSRGPQTDLDAATHRCDLFWPKQGVSLEYEGEKWHTGFSRVVSDSGRDNSMAAKRLLVFKLTKVHLENCELFDCTARQIARALGKRMRMDDSPYNWLTRRADLRAKLIPWEGNRLCDERVGRGNR